MCPSLSDLQDWAARGESEIQEFKIRSSAGCRREAAQTLCGMLNSRGGRVMFGVDPSGALVGQMVSDLTIEHIVAEFARIEPAVYPEIERVPLDRTRGEIVVASVGQSYRRPHTYKGKAFRRVGNTTQELSREEYHELLIEARHAQRRWGERASRQLVDRAA